MIILLLVCFACAALLESSHARHQLVPVEFCSGKKVHAQHVSEMAMLVLLSFRVCTSHELIPVESRSGKKVHHAQHASEMTILVLLSLSLNASHQLVPVIVVWVKYHITRMFCSMLL